MSLFLKAVCLLSSNYFGFDLLNGRILTDTINNSSGFCAHASAKVHLVNVFSFAIESAVKMLCFSLQWTGTFWLLYKDNGPNNIIIELAEFWQWQDTTTLLLFFFLVYKSAFINNNSNARISNCCLRVRLIRANVAILLGILWSPLSKLIEI